MIDKVLGDQAGHEGFAHAALFAADKMDVGHEIAGGGSHLPPKVQVTIRIIDVRTWHRNSSKVWHLTLDSTGRECFRVRLSLINRRQALPELW